MTLSPGAIVISVGAKAKLAMETFAPLTFSVAVAVCGKLALSEALPIAIVAPVWVGWSMAETAAGGAANTAGVIFSEAVSATRQVKRVLIMLNSPLGSLVICLFSVVIPNSRWPPRSAGRQLCEARCLPPPFSSDRWRDRRR